MAKTINRQPFSVSTPSSNEAKDYFFNHHNWKGMSSDKNFLTADQETFESCNNVYMDSEGLLRSRPAIKTLDNSLNLNIVNFWVFNDTVLLLSKTSDGHYDIYACDTNFENVKASTVDTEYYYPNDKIKPLQLEDKIFIFAPDSLRCINTKSWQIADAKQFIYTPETRVNTSDTNYQEAESKNALTDSEIFTYIYNSNLSIDFMLGKTLYFTLYDKTYTVQFNSLTPLTFFKRLPIIITVASANCSFKVFPRDGYDSIVFLNESTGDFLYSSDGSTWNIAKNFPIVSLGSSWYFWDFEFTQDGNELYCHLTDGTNNRYYIVSVEKTLQNNVLVYRYENVTEYLFPNTHSSRVCHRLFLCSWNEGLYLYALASETYLVKFFNSTETTINYTFASETVSIPLSGVFYMYTNFDLDKYLIIFSYSDSEDDFNGKGYENDEFVYKNMYILLDSNNQHISHGKLLFNTITAASAYDWTRINTNTIIFTGYDDIGIYQYQVSISGINISANLLYRYAGNYTTPNKFAVSKDGSTILTDSRSDGFSYIFKNGNRTKLLEPILNKLFAIGNYYYISIASNTDIKYILTNNIDTLILKQNITESDDSKLNNFLQSLFNGGESEFVELQEYYVAVADTLYISSKRHDDYGNVLLYLPEINKQKFTSNITGLQPISSTEVAIFLADEIWYSQITENGYTYTKSKLQLGLKDGSDIITSYDGTKVIFPTKRGLVALSYQDFVSSTDQILTFLSDSIHDLFVEFSESPVKLLRYQYWIICYRTDNEKAYMYDIRNNSWWPISASITFKKLLDVDNKVVLLGDKLYELNKDDTNYFDDNGQVIEWNIQSQKLHLNAPNYYKHIANMTLMCVLDSDDAVSFKLEVNNYRKIINTTNVTTHEYYVNVIRTYVQRMSFPKVNEFQYTLRSDNEQIKRVPLSLSGITIKYRIGSQVR